MSTQINCDLVRASISYWRSSPLLLQAGGEYPQYNDMWYQASPATTTQEFCFESPASETSFANSSANRNYLVEPAGWCGINRGNDSQRKTWPLIPQPGTASSLPTTASLKPRVQGSRPYAQVNRGTRRSFFFSNYDLRGILHVERARHKTEVPVVSKCLQGCAALISCCITNAVGSGAAHQSLPG